MPARSLLSPLVHSDPRGITLLTGANVALVPQRITTALSRLVGAAHRRQDGEIDLVAFMATRAGIAGCRGVLSDDADGLALVDVEAFGTESSITTFGMAFGRLLREEGRFSESPRICLAAGPISLAWLADGLAAAGADLGTAARPCCMA